MNPLTFLQSVAGYTQAQRTSSADRPVLLATIDPTYSPVGSDLPRVTFDGESTLSGKRYPTVNGYTPFPGDRVYLIPIGTTYLIGGTLGQFSAPRGVIGGKEWNQGGSDLSTGIVGTEALTNMDTGSLLLTGGRRYMFHAKFKYLASSAVDSYWQMRIRVGSLVGTQIAEWVFNTVQNSFGKSENFLISYEPAADVTSNFVLTAQRLSGSAGLSINRGSASNPSWFTVEDKGETGKVVQVA